MQYRGQWQIAKGNQQQPLNFMPHFSSHALRLCPLLLVLALTACADTVSSPPPSSQLQRQYDKTLTKAEQQAVISDLQGATAKKEGEAGGEAATGAESEENTN
jgi:hypothetical protein